MSALATLSRKLYSVGQISKFVQRKIAIIYSSISLYMCFGCSKEPSHYDSSFEYPQHWFWLRNKKKIFSIWGPAVIVNPFPPVNTYDLMMMMMMMMWFITNSKRL